jgi:hypothetical protein
MYRLLVVHSPDNVRRRSGLYLMAYCGLFLAFISGMRPSSSPPEMPELLWAMAFLTGCLALVLRRELRAPSAGSGKALSTSISADPTAQSTRLDRIASLIAKRQDGSRSNLSEAFPEFESQETARAGPKTAPASRQRDPFSSVLANLPDRAKRVDRS